MWDLHGSMAKSTVYWMPKLHLRRLPWAGRRSQHEAPAPCTFAGSDQQGGPLGPGPARDTSKTTLLRRSRGLSCCSLPAVCLRGHGASLVTIVACSTC